MQSNNLWSLQPMQTNLYTSAHGKDFKYLLFSLRVENPMTSSNQSLETQLILSKLLWYVLNAFSFNKAGFSDIFFVINKIITLVYRIWHSQPLTKTKLQIPKTLWVWFLLLSSKASLQKSWWTVWQKTCPRESIPQEKRYPQTSFTIANSDIKTVRTECKPNFYVLMRFTNF